MSTNASIETNEIGKSEILDILTDDTPVEVEDIPAEENQSKDDKKDDKTSEAKAEEEIKLVEEKEDEEEKPTYDEDEIDIIAPARRQEILKKYPTLFKDFPHLEKAYFRDQKYNELFGTPDDAQRVVDLAKEYQQVSSTVMSGSTEPVLKVLKDQNPQAFGKVVDNYLTTLKNVDERAFYHVVGNTIKSTVATMVGEAQRTQNEDLLNAARVLHQFVLGTTQWENPQSYSNLNSKQPSQQEQQEQTELAREKMDFFRERLDTVQSDLQSRVDGVLKNTIDQNMDPKGSMTNYVKRVAVQEAMDNVQRAIGTDTNFRRLLDRLWERAAEDRFSKQSTEKIRSAYLAKAKTLLPQYIKQSRNEALRGLGKRVREDSNESDEGTVRVQKDAASPPKTLRGTNRGENPSKGKSTLAFLNED